MKTGRKLLVWVLITVMCTGLMPMSAFADDADEQKDNKVELVVFGNSTSSGYGLSDYNSGGAIYSGFSPRNDDLNNYPVEEALGNNTGRLSSASFLWKLKQYIADKEFGGDLSQVELSDFALNGMRIEEVLAFLQKDYYDSVTACEARYKEKWMSEHEPKAGKEYDGFLTTRVRRYYDAFYRTGEIDTNDYQAGCEYVQNKIRNADVIVLDACGNSFGTYIGYRLAAYAEFSNEDASPNIYETIEDVDGLPDELKNAIKSIKDQLVKRVGPLNNEFVLQILDAYMFAAASCIVSYSATVESIRQINPDAKIISVGLVNSLKGMNIEMGDTRIDMGQVMGKLSELINLYIRCIDKNSKNVYFADLSNNVETMGIAMSEKETLEDVLADGPADGFLKNEQGETVVDEFGNDVVDVRSNYALRKLFQRVDGADTSSKVGFNPSYLNGMFTADPDPVTGGKTFYDTIVTENFKQNGVTLKNWDEMKENDIITGIHDVYDITLYITFNFDAADMSQLFGYETTDDLHPVGKIGKKPGAAETDPDDTTIYLTKKNIDKVVYKAYQLLFDSVHHNVVNVASALALMQDRDAAAKDIMKYIFGGTDSVSDDTLGLLYFLIRFQMSNSLAEHPDSKGCDEKYDAVEAAYESNTTAYDGAKAELQAKLQELVAEMREIGKKIREAINETSYKTLLDDLDQLYEQLKVLGLAAVQLPYYENAVDEYNKITESLIDEMAGNKDDVITLKYRVADLKARAIKVQLAPVVSFPGGKVQVSLSWASDDRAAGYEFLVDGIKTSPVASGDKLTYVHKGLKVGQKHTYQVTPYIIEEIDGIEETFYGKTITRTVTPKVAVGKVSLKNAKAGKKSVTIKWKKVSGASGYEISCKVGKKTSKKIVNSGSKSSLKIRKLKSGKKCTVKVRAWKTVNGKKYYGKWSKTKKAKIK